MLLKSVVYILSLRQFSKAWYIFSSLFGSSAFLKILLCVRNPGIFCWIHLSWIQFFCLLAMVPDHCFLSHPFLCQRSPIIASMPAIFLSTNVLSESPERIGPNSFHCQLSLSFLYSQIHFYWEQKKAVF